LLVTTAVAEVIRVYPVETSNGITTVVFVGGRWEMIVRVGNVQKRVVISPEQAEALITGEVLESDPLRSQN
jgi:hypothetical protein